MPFDAIVQQAIIGLTNIRSEFVDSKKEINGNNGNSQAQSMVNELRLRLEPEIFAVNKLIASQLNSFFKFLTQ